MTKHEPWFIEERAFAFASLLLTKHNDALVRSHDGACDLLVEILKGGKSTSRFFGVQMVAYLDLPNIQNADERVLDPFEAGLPICVFVIGVRRPEGIYRWTVEPVIDGGRAVLRQSAVSRRDVEASWKTLDDEGVARLIGQVNAWYDALNGGATPKPRGRHSKTES